jgi:hypothetical protein
MLPSIESLVCTLTPFQVILKYLKRSQGPQIRMARHSCSDNLGVDEGTFTPPLIRFHRIYIYSSQPCIVSNFDAWITFFQEISAVYVVARKIDSYFRSIRISDEYVQETTPRSLILHLAVYVNVIV